MIKKILKKIIYKLSIIASKNRWLTVFYYTINTKGFQHEQHNVLRGVIKNKTDKNNIANFRRAIHRIEKGLITQPLKPIFAESYILETVLTYKRLLNDDCDKTTLLWGKGILIQYFEIVEKTDIITKAYSEFLKLIEFETSNLPSTYFANERVRSKITIDDFFELNKQRRSIRYYQNKEVPREIVEKAIKIALQSPSACNRQPFSFRVIDDPSMLRTAASLPMGATTFSDNIPMMVFIIGDLSSYFDERDKHIIYIDASLAAMNFILALEVQGLSSCIINWSDIPKRNKRLKKFLKLEDWEQCVMTISLGYTLPECGIASSIKKDVESVTKYN